MSNNPLSDIKLYIDRVNPHLSPLRVLQTVHSLRRARSVLKLSQSQLGAEIARLLGLTEPVSQVVVSNWENGKKKMPRPCIDAVGRLLATWLMQQMRRDEVGIRLTVNSPWRIMPMARCHCGRWYELRRAKQSLCGKHRR